MKGVPTTIEDLSMALSLADQNGMSVEEKRKLKKKVCIAVSKLGVEPDVRTCDKRFTFLKQRLSFVLVSLRALCA